jgi:hypothetical protein
MWRRESISEHEPSLARTTNNAPFGYPVKGALAKV